MVKMCMKLKIDVCSSVLRSLEHLGGSQVTELETLAGLEIMSGEIRDAFVGGTIVRYTGKCFQENFFPLPLLSPLPFTASS